MLVEMQCMFLEPPILVPGIDTLGDLPRGACEEHIVSTPEGVVVRNSAVKPLLEAQWDTALFDAIVGVPWDPMGWMDGWRI